MSLLLAGIIMFGGSIVQGTIGFALSMISDTVASRSRL